MTEGQPRGYLVGPVVGAYIRMLNEGGSNIDPRDRYNIGQLIEGPRQMAIAHWAIDRALEKAQQWQKTKEGSSDILVFTRVIVESDLRTRHKTTVDAADENQLTWLRNWKELLRGEGAMDNLNRMSQASTNV